MQQRSCRVDVIKKYHNNTRWLEYMPSIVSENVLTTLGFIKTV